MFGWCVLLTAGCAKMAAESSSAPGYPQGSVEAGGRSHADYGGDAMADGEYEAYDNKAEYAPEEMDGPTDDAMMPAPAMASPAPMPNGGMAPPPPPSEPRSKPAPSSGKDPQPQQFARQIIYTAEMQVSVFKLEDAMKRTEELTVAAGGYVQNLSEGYFILRIPAPALRGVMEDLGKLGVVERRSLQARDVSEEFFDLVTRIRVLRETQQQLLELLKQARNVEEALKVRQSLDAITLELEQAQGRLRLLESQIGFSTLTVHMSQRGPQNTIPSSNDPFPWVDGLGVEATEWN